MIGWEIVEIRASGSESCIRVESGVRWSTAFLFFCPFSRESPLLRLIKVFTGGIRDRLTRCVIVMSPRVMLIHEPKVQSAPHVKTQGFSN